uniref:Putative capsid VP1 n=1 Tax=uncultured virus TaxID=340016 RepID=A0A1D8MK91_9VIRU|nr:putative capsid VP1 [uncultured virus]
MAFFNDVAINRNPRAKFNLSHEKKLTIQQGDLIPVMCMETLPGDKWRVQSELFMRMQALLSPVMHRFDATIHYFFVPNRLIWSEFEDFITRGRAGTTAPIHPAVLMDNVTKARYGVGTLADYLGLPDVSGLALTGARYVNALPFRAYQLIYDEYYRDNIITPPIDAAVSSGLIGASPELDKLMTIRKRAWGKDYFTTARPSPQLGAEAVINATNVITYKANSAVRTTAGATAPNNTLIGVDTAGGDDMRVGKASAAGAGTSGGRIENIASIGTSIQVNALRIALAIQRFAERNMRVGARYTEQLFGRWGVKSSDARLQRPEYLGGGNQAVNISEVLQTAEGTNPVGTMNGHGYAVGGQNKFKKPYYVEEHGYIMAILSVIPKTAYQQGIDRMWTRDDVFDYATPEFANIGEQEVKQSELWVDPNLATDPTFGYQERYSEYKYQPNTVHGEFKTSLAYWHAGRIFTAAPLLNTSFIEADPTQRIFAVTDPAVDKLLVQIYHRCDVLRQLPYHGVPAIE